jgi:hypothetical protein
MASVGSVLVAFALAASEPSSLEKIERRAGILSGVGIAFAVGGGVAVGVGVAVHEPRFTVGGSALIGVALHLVALAVVAWLWPDDSWLGLLTDETTTAGARAWSLALP